MLWIYQICLLILAGGISAQTEYSLCFDQSGKEYSIAVILPLSENCEEKSTSIKTPLTGRATTVASGLTDVNLLLLDSCNREDILLKHVTNLLPYNSILPSLQTTIPDDLGVCQSNRTRRILGVITTHQISDQSDAQPIIASHGSNYPIISLYDGPRPISDQPIIYHLAPQNIGEILLDIAVKVDWDIMTVVYSELYYKYSRSVISSLALERFICIQNEIVINKSNLSVLSLESDAAKGILYIGEEGLGLSLLQLPTISTHTVIMQILDEAQISGTNNNVIAIKPTTSIEDDLADSIRFISSCIPSASFAGCNNITAQLQSQLTREDQAAIIFKGRQLQYVDNSTELYKIYKLDSTWSEIGQVTSTGTSYTNTDLSLFRSLCTDDSCSSTCSYVNDRQYIYKPGDLHFIMTLPIQSVQSSDNVWRCSGWSNFENMARTLTAESVISMLNDRDNSRVKYGIVVLDSCFNPLKTSTNTTAILSELSRICTSDGTKCLDPKTVIAIISDYSSGVALAVQRAAMQIPVIQVAYGASSPIFDDEEVYKYFLRTNPSDARQAKNIATLCRLIGESQGQNGGTVVHSVNLFYTGTPYGQGGKIIREHLIKNNISVARENLLEEYVGKSQEFFELLSKPPTGQDELVRLSIVFGENDKILNHLNWLNGSKGIQSRTRERWLATGNIFVFGDTWGNSDEFRQKYGHLIRGSLSLSFGTDFLVQNTLISDLSNHPLTASRMNPWFSPFIQRRSSCKIRGDFSNSMNAANGDNVDLCTEKLSEQTFDQSTVQIGETFLSHSVKAVLAIVNAMEKSISCPPQSSVATCINQGVGQLYNEVLDSKLGQSTNDWDSQNGKRVFNNEGNGAVGFIVHQIIYAANEFENVRYHEPYYFDINDKPSVETSLDFYKYNSEKGGDVRSTLQSGSMRIVNIPPTATPASQGPDYLLVGISVALGVLVLAIAFGFTIYILKKRKARRSGESVYARPRSVINECRQSDYQVPTTAYDNRGFGLEVSCEANAGQLAADGKVYYNNNPQ